MKFRSILLPTLFCLLSLNSYSERIVRIDGQELQQTIGRISFKGDTAVLHFSDTDSLSTHCLLLSIEFTEGSGLSPLQNTRVLLARNPVKDILPLENLQAGSRLLLYDIEGRLVKTQQAHASSVQIDLSDLPAGVYLLRTGKYLGRFVKL